MTKTATRSTRSPYVFGPGLPIYEDDLQAVVEAQNYAAGASPTLYFSLTTGVAAWGLAGSIATHNLLIPGTAGATTYYQCKIWIDADEQTIVCGARFHGLVAPNEVTATWTIGGDSDVSTHTSVDNEVEKTITLDVATTGTGWQTFSLAINHTVGAYTLIYLHGIRCEAGPIAATSLPGPVDE